MIISFKDLKYFFSSKIIFFLFASLWLEEFKRQTLVLVPEIVTQTTAAQIEKGLLFLGIMLVCGWNLPYLKVNRRYKRS